MYEKLKYMASEKNANTKVQMCVDLSFTKGSIHKQRWSDIWISLIPSPQWTPYLNKANLVIWPTHREKSPFSIG